MVSGLNPTIVLRYIRRILGLSKIEFELTDEEIMKVVFQESLATYSNYFPYLLYTVLKTADKVPGTRNEWRLPTTDLKLVGIERVIDNGYSLSGSGIGYLPLASTNPFTSQLTSDLLSATTPKITAMWVSPNKLTLLPAYTASVDFLVIMRAVHPEHLRTIDQELKEDFEKLCVDDVLISVYSMRHRFQSISTAFGSLEVFNELVDGARGEREELLTKWANTMNNTGANMKKIYVG